MTGIEINERILRIHYIIGVVALIIGAIDPLEGSVVISAGSVCLMLSTLLRKDRQRKTFFILFLMILSGIFFLFFFSSLGGGRGTSSLSWWWGLLILLYPTGWLLAMVLIIKMAVKKGNELENVVQRQEIFELWTELFFPGKRKGAWSGMS